MRPNAQHLFKSRHGIWYFRWIVPQEYRQRHPELPRELKRSTKTADTRVARAVARRLHCALLLRYSNGNDMASPLDGIRFSGWTYRRDANGTKEITVTPEDTPEMLARLDRVIEADSIADMMRAQIAAVVSSANTAAIGSRTLIAEATERYGRFQMQGSWSENTFKHTHEPSLRLFRELVGVPMPATGTDGAETQTVDRPLEELTRADIERFVEEFWRFPALQGKRPGRAARDFLNEGGRPQSRANVFKRLAHIRQFLVFCKDKGYTVADLVAEVDLVLATDTARSRDKAAVAGAAGAALAADGYVAFTSHELQSLFGPEFCRHSAGNAARYWIPLIGLYAGLRVSEASQLRSSDIVELEGVLCLRVTGESLGDVAEPETQRVKTRASIRTVPVHPMLIELGLVEYSKRRQAQGDKWLWDKLLWTAKSGFGKYPSRDFQKLATMVGVYQPRRKVFHSFRSTISQQLEIHGLEGELIDRFLGHEVKTTRNLSYNRTNDGRAYPVKRVLEVLAKVDFGISPKTPSA